MVKWGLLSKIVPPRCTKSIAHPSSPSNRKGQPRAPQSDPIVRSSLESSGMMDLATGVLFMGHTSRPVVVARVHVL